MDDELSFLYDDDAEDLDFYYDEVPVDVSSGFTAEKYLNMYINKFSKTCFNQEDLAFATFHMLLGSLNNIRKLYIPKANTRLDPRVHIFYIAPSGSGKGAAMNFITRCASDAGLVHQSCGAITTNALTGTREKKPKPANSDTDFERWQMTDGYLNPDAMPSNFVFFTEAAELITTRPAPDMNKCLDHFQKAMNPLGTEDNRISKKTALGPEITFFPNTTLFFTTYEPLELAEVITQRGFLQRCLFLIRDPTIEERFEDMHEVIGSTGTPPMDTYEISKLLIRINKHFKDKDIIKVSPSTIPIAQKQLQYYYKLLLNCNDYLAKRLVDFVPRFNDMYWKIALHSAVLRLDDTIREEDVSYAYMMLHDRFLSTFEFLQKNLPIPREEVLRQRTLFNRVKKMFDTASLKTKREWLPLTTTRDALVNNKLFISRRDAMKYLARLDKARIATIRNNTIKINRDLHDGEIF